MIWSELAVEIDASVALSSSLLPNGATNGDLSDMAAAIRDCVRIKKQIDKLISLVKTNNIYIYIYITHSILSVSSAIQFFYVCVNSDRFFLLYILHLNKARPFHHKRFDSIYGRVGSRFSISVSRQYETGPIPITPPGPGQRDVKYNLWLLQTYRWLQTPQYGAVDEHLADSHVDRQGRQMAAQRSQRRAVVATGADLL